MNIALIPLRSKSKGLKNKNILPFKNEKYLINYVIKKILKLKIFNEIYVLTDSSFYKKIIIKNSKVSTSYVRSKSLSMDKSKVSDLLLDFSSWYEKKNNNKIKNFFLFQATSPIWRIIEIKKCINFFLKKKNIESLVTASKPIQSPISFAVGKDKKWKFLIQNKSQNRQDYRENYYFINGVLFACSKDFLKKYKKIYSNKSHIYEVSKHSISDINDYVDYNIARQITDFN